MCPGDCRGRGRCVQGVCLCYAGYSGEDCGQEEPPASACPGGCGPRELCREGQCVCVEGFRGPDCAIQTCPGDCRGRGECLQGRCICQDGYAGDDCGEEVPAIQNMRMHLLEETTVRTEWTRAPGPVDAYEIQFIPMTEGASPPFTARVPSSASAYDQRGLAPGQDYQVTVRALRGTSWGPPASKTITTMIDGPQDLRVVAVTPTTLDLSWLRPQAEVDRFVVSYVSAGNQRVRLEVPPEADRTQLTDLMPGVEYVVTVTAERGRAVSYPASIRANTVQDLERHLRAHGYPLRANQTYTSVARHIYEFLRRHQRAGAPASKPHQPHPTASPTQSTGKWDSNQGDVDPASDGAHLVTTARHPKPEVLGSAVDGALIVSLDGLRGQFERVVLRWRPLPPAEGPSGELTVDGSERTVRLPNLRPGTTYHVEVHGVRAGQTSKSYAFITTTGSLPSGLLEATDEPPPSGPSTTQGAQAPILILEHHPLGELQVLGRDKAGRLRVAWTAQPGTFSHFQLRMQVAEGPWAHEELLPGDVRQALVPPPPPGAPYKLLLQGITPGGKPSVPITYQGIMDRAEEQPGKPSVLPRLGELTVSSLTSDSLLLHWTVLEGEFDSFVIQYKDKDGPQVIPVEGPQRSAPVTSLEPGRKYRFILYGLIGKKKHGPLVAEAKILLQSDPSPGSPPRLGELWVTDPTPDSLHLSWTVPEGQFDSFLVQYRDKEGRPLVVPVEGPERSVVVSPLDPNHKYRFTLFGVANKKRYGPLTADGTTAPAKEEGFSEQPLLGELTVTGMTPDSLRLSWTVARGPFDSFVIQYKDAQGQPQTVPVAGDENEVTVPGLESNRKYKMNLYGLRGRQRVGPVSVVAKTAPPHIVDQPSSPPEPSTEAPQPLEKPRLGELTVTDATPDSLSLSWTVPEGQFDQFVIQYKNGDGQPKVVRVPGHEDQVTIPGLEPDHKWALLIGAALHTADPAISVSDSQPEEEIPPAIEPPLEPRLEELTVTGVTPNSVSLSWMVPEGQFDSFMVQYKDRDGQPQEVPVSSDQRKVTILDLDPARKYKMNFYGLHGRRRVGPLSVLAMTDTLPPAPPPATEAPKLEPRLGELMVTDVTPDSVGLLWTVPEGEFDSFMVQYKDRDGQPQVVPVAADQREVTIPGLEPSRKYKFLLFGLRDGRRRGQVSVETKTAARDDTSPGALPRLGELWVTDPTTDSLRLSWTVPEGHFDSFMVQFKDKGGPQVLPVDGHERTATITALDAGRKYRFLLYGLQGKKRFGPLTTEGTTEPMNTVDHTGVKAPPKPRLGEELRVTSVTQDSVDLSWTVSEGHFDSFVVQYKDRDGQSQVVPVEGGHREVRVSGLDPGHRYKLLLYGLRESKRVGPLSVIAVTGPKEATEAWTEVPTTSTPSVEPHLRELRVEEATPHSLRLSWVVTEGEFDSFEVQYTDRDGKLKVVSTEGDQSDVILTGLESDHRYLVTLYGFHDGHRVDSAQIEALTVPWEEEEPTEPPTVTPKPKPHLGELTVTDATPDSLSLSWTVPEGQFDQFVIQYKNGDGQPKEREATVRDLEPGRKYKMNLYGLHEGQRVGPVSTVGVTDPEEETTTTQVVPTMTTKPPPERPRLGELTVADATPDSLSLSWTVPEGQFDHFLVQYRNGDGQPKEREATVRDLEPGHKYKMNLYGLHQGQRVGPVSTVGVTALLPTELPTEPRLGDLAVVEVTSSTVHLSWTVARGPFDSFLVQYKDAQGQPQTVPVSRDLGEVTVSGLDPARKYKFLLFGLQGGERHGPVSVDAKTAPLEKAPQPRLGELSVTGETPDSLRLLWTVAQGPFDSFLVQYRDRDGQLQTVAAAADQNEVTIEGLQPRRKYKFLLYGLAGGKRLGPISALGVTAPEEDMSAPSPTEPPEAPRLGTLTVTEATPDSLRLSWGVARGPFESFVVQYQDTEGQRQALLVDGDQDKVLISGLEPSTSYKFFLYGLREGMRHGPISAEGTTGPVPAGQTPGDPGPRLSQLSVTDVTTSSLRLNWEAPLRAFDTFLIRFGVPSPSTLEPYPRPLVQRELMVPGTQRSAVLRDLHPGTLYSLTLYGLRGPHKADSIQGTARTLSPVLESPRDLQFSDIGETSARVDWVPPPSRVDSFKLSYQLADGGEPQSVLVDARTQTQILQGLMPDTRYEVTVVSVRGFEESEPLTGFLTTVPDGPTQLRALNLTDGSALLHWKPPHKPVDEYNVQVASPGAPPLQASAPGSAVDYALTDLAVDTNYTATVRGLRGPNFTSPASITFTTGLKPPQDLEAKEVTPRTALLTWTEPEVPPTGYLLSFDTPGGQIQEILLPAGTTSHRLLRLFPSTFYSAQLRAVWGESLTPPVSTSFTTGGLHIPFPRDCGEEMQNGPSASKTTTIFLNGNRERPLDVFCDMETDGGGWLVFQRRMDGQTDFWRDWEEYAHGFGNISREFWLGNEVLHSLTQAGDYSMRVDLRAGDEAVFAQYDFFRVDSAVENYRLHLEGYHGTAGDSMSYHSGSVFSARDRDPNNLLISCAVSYRGAWWYRNCHYANLNGLYGSTVDHQGVSWYHWKGFEFSVPFTEMKLRPRNFQAPTRGS
ncbi:tenascin [Cricetulus griseus]|uniref:Tenascin n=1 Tax=Cricetulus griseus TaxID=10029 RepID=A0A061IN52_CRIGR|nr:tenascin [Cricetulus griseus]